MYKNCIKIHHKITQKLHQNYTHFLQNYTTHITHKITHIFFIYMFVLSLLSLSCSLIFNIHTQHLNHSPYPRSPYHLPYNITPHPTSHTYLSERIFYPYSHSKHSLDKLTLYHTNHLYKPYTHSYSNLVDHNLQSTHFTLHNVQYSHKNISKIIK